MGAAASSSSAARYAIEEELKRPLDVSDLPVDGDAARAEVARLRDLLSSLTAMTAPPTIGASIAISANGRAAPEAPSGATVAVPASVAGIPPHANAATPAAASTALRVIIAGAPASGKGTQCERIVKAYNLVHLSTGDMLRAAVAAGTDVGLEAKSYMDSGKLVPDETITNVVVDRLARPDCAERGWLLDGFPRTRAQADALAAAGVEADVFVLLDVPDEDLVARVVGRRTDPVTGTIYHTTFKPPPAGEVADRCTQRSDDTEEKVKVRLQGYHANIDAVSSCYAAITSRVNGARDSAAVFADVNAALVGGGGGGAPAAPGPCSLRIFTVNDVYELDKLAMMKTCIDTLRTDNTVVLLQGDFLAPSLLSSLDKGKGMVDTMNAIGVQYVCLGNHESDVPHAELLKRIGESNFEWVNTNMQRLPLGPGMAPLPTHATFEVTGGGQTRTVGLLGLNTGDPGLYRKDSWGGLGASCVDDIDAKAVEYRAKLLSGADGCRKCDLVVPMTHQVMPLDREFAERRHGFPLVLGGHDHQLYHEEVAGATLLKMGADADTIGVVDLTWDSAATPGDAPTIAVRKLPAEDYVPDPEVSARINMHKSVLDALDQATLCNIPKGVELTSVGIRLRQVTMGTLVTTSLRKATGADCALINAGNIRGNTAYPPDKRALTYSDLKAEVPFDSVVVCVELPGRVISETVAFTRAPSLEAPPVEKGMYMQLDDGMAWDAATNAVTRIGGEPIDLDKMYECVVLWQVAVEGIDGVAPLRDYVASHPKHVPTDADAGRPAKEVLVDHFSHAVWWTLVSEIGFDGLDADGDGVISRAEITAAITSKYGDSLGELVVDNLMAMADLNGDGCVDREELLAVCFLSVSMFVQSDVDHDRVLDYDEVAGIVKRVFGANYDPSMVDRLFDGFDHDTSAGITFKEVRSRADSIGRNLVI